MFRRLVAVGFAAVVLFSALPQQPAQAGIFSNYHIHHNSYHGNHAVVDEAGVNRIHASSWVPQGVTGRAVVCLYHKTYGQLACNNWTGVGGDPTAYGKDDPNRPAARIQWWMYYDMGWPDWCNYYTMHEVSTTDHPQTGNIMPGHIRSMWGCEQVTASVSMAGIGEHYINGVPYIFNVLQVHYEATGMQTLNTNLYFDAYQGPSGPYLGARGPVFGYQPDAYNCNNTLCTRELVAWLPRVYGECYVARAVLDTGARTESPSYGQRFCIY